MKQNVLFNLNTTDEEIQADCCLFNLTKEGLWSAN
jgi:hypothetical protein